MHPVRGTDKWQKIVASTAGVLLADMVIEGLAEERFMNSTHPWVLEKFAVKARGYDEYIAMMRAGRAAETAKTAGGDTGQQHRKEEE